MSAPTTGFRGTQVYDSFGSATNYDQNGDAPGTLIGNSCKTLGWSAPSAGYYTFKVSRPLGGSVSIGVFRKKSGSPSIQYWTDVDLVSETSGTGTVSIVAYCNSGDQLVIAGDSVNGWIDECEISNPDGTVTAPTGAKVVYNGIDHFQPWCGTSGATILWKKRSDATYQAYAGPVSLAGVPDKTVFDLFAVKANNLRSSAATWTYNQ